MEYGGAWHNHVALVPTLGYYRPSRRVSAQSRCPRLVGWPLGCQTAGITDPTGVPYPWTEERD